MSQLGARSQPHMRGSSQSLGGPYGSAGGQPPYGTPASPHEHVSPLTRGASDASPGAGTSISLPLTKVDMRYIMRRRMTSFAGVCGGACRAPIWTGGHMYHACMRGPVACSHMPACSQQGGPKRARILDHAVMQRAESPHQQQSQMHGGRLHAHDVQACTAGAMRRARGRSPTGCPTERSRVPLVGSHRRIRA